MPVNILLLLFNAITIGMVFRMHIYYPSCLRGGRLQRVLVQLRQQAHVQDLLQLPVGLLRHLAHLLEEHDVGEQVRDQLRVLRHLFVQHYVVHAASDVVPDVTWISHSLL